MKPHKSTLLGGLLLMGSYAVSAQGINVSQVPAPVQQAFQAKFSKATDIEWKREGGQYKIGVSCINGTKVSCKNVKPLLNKALYQGFTI